tara:strand:- start:2875 stop:3732 length:858 start_codon:yes stop_codon:yes gene_type:complete
MARWVGHSIEEFKKIFRHNVSCESTLSVKTTNYIGEDSRFLVLDSGNLVGHRTIANLKADVGNASQDARGIVELATTAETTTGTDTVRAVTPDGLKDGYQGSTNVTTLGTIATGTWQGTAIATDYLKHKATFELAGYAVADGTNYMMADIMSGNKAPFLHDETSIGANGTTADNPAAFLRAAGTVMPYNGTLKIWKGWGASNGSPTVDIGIFKYTPTADDATSASLVLVKNTQITGAGNDNLKAFSETSFSVTVAAGDILITAIKGSVNAKTAYFVSTVEIEWTS